ncbi:hypothetical protein BC629DRAFT_1570822 [Irpex lacteus]|nr:hypothetical protein BC629DRAFT_1570822 [Irpex lacteus]
MSLTKKLFKEKVRASIDLVQSSFLTGNYHRQRKVGFVCSTSDERIKSAAALAEPDAELDAPTEYAFHSPSLSPLGDMTFFDYPPFEIKGESSQTAGPSTLKAQSPSIKADSGSSSSSHSTPTATRARFTYRSKEKKNEGLQFSDDLKVDNPWE